MGSIRLWRWLLKEIDITDVINNDPIEAMDGFLLGETGDEGEKISSPFYPQTPLHNVISRSGSDEKSDNICTVKDFSRWSK
jgi:hypothetical protein